MYYNCLIIYYFNLIYNDVHLLLVIVFILSLLIQLIFISFHFHTIIIMQLNFTQFYLFIIDYL